MTLYWNLLSQPSRAVKAALLMGNVPHNTVSINLMKGEHKQEAYTKVNPRQMVPFIQDKDFGLSESTAILKYLCETYASVPEYLWPKDEKLRALTDQFIEYYSFEFRPALIGPTRWTFAKKQGKDVPD